MNVWLTLPVGSSGLMAEGQGVLTSMLAAGVRPAGVNGDDDGLRGAVTGRRSMADQGELALTALQQQIQDSPIRRPAPTCPTRRAGTWSGRPR